MFKDALTSRLQLFNTLSKFASLRAQGTTDEQLKTGNRCDPTSKSNLRIIAKKDILIRLTRNLDKARGFVNGAIATAATRNVSFALCKRRRHVEICVPLELSEDGRPIQLVQLGRLQATRINGKQIRKTKSCSH